MDFFSMMPFFGTLTVHLACSSSVFSWDLMLVSVLKKEDFLKSRSRMVQSA